MNHGRLRYFICIAVPALGLTAAGIYLVWQLDRNYRAEHQALCTDTRQRMMDQIHDFLKHGDMSNKRFNELLLSLSNLKVPIQGGFVWEKNVGVIAATGMPESVLTELTPKYKWIIKGEEGKKDVQGAAAQSNWESIGNEMVFWHRLPSGKVTVGILADPPPEYNWRLTWGIGGCLSLFLPLTLLAAAVSLVRDARRAERENTQKTNFVSHVSHELKTPLAGIVPLAQMLRKGKITDSEDLREAYDVIADESVRLSSMVEDLLALTRLELKRKTYALSSFDVVQLAREAAQVVRPRFVEGLLSVVGESPVVVRADHDSVKGIFVNLLDNAAKYSPGTPVEIVVENPCDGRVRIAVRDRGQGLTRDQMDRVFDSFWRADDRTVAETGGFGLGLAIAHGHARGMGGDLTVSSRPGGGAVFTLELPEGNYG